MRQKELGYPAFAARFLFRDPWSTSLQIITVVLFHASLLTVWAFEPRPLVKATGELLEYSAWLCFFTGLCAACGVMYTRYARRAADFGVIESLGATRSQIGRLAIWENLLISLLAAGLWLAFFYSADIGESMASGLQLRPDDIGFTTWLTSTLTATVIYILAAMSVVFLFTSYDPYRSIRRGR